MRALHGIRILSLDPEIYGIEGEDAPWAEDTAEGDEKDSSL